MRWQAAVAIAAIGVTALATGSSAPASEQPISIVAFKDGYPSYDLDEGIDNVECMLGVGTLARYHKSGLRGFAARLSPQQLGRLERSGLVRPALEERGHFLLRLFGPADPDQRMAELARNIGFTVDMRFNHGNFRGWGATLDWLQLLRLDFEGDVTHITDDSSDYVVWFDHVYGEAAVQRTAELEQKYGFHSPFVLQGLGGFYAVLSNAQVAALSEESDLDDYTPVDNGGMNSSPSNHANCLHSSALTRRDLTTAFRNSHPRGEVVGRVLYARLAGPQRELGPVVVTQYAVATFRTPASTVTELFKRKPKGRWRDLGPLGERICVDRIPRVTLQIWLLRPVSTNCYATS